jgi:hypothetical protein
MNQGVEILLARMDSNPEEFLTGNKAGKWQHLLEKYEEYMTDEERKAVFTKYHSLKMSKFTEVVLKELLEEQDGVSLYAREHPSKIFTSPQQMKDDALKLLEITYGDLAITTDGTIELKTKKKTK